MERKKVSVQGTEGVEGQLLLITGLCPPYPHACSISGQPDVMPFTAEAIQSLLHYCTKKSMLRGRTKGKRDINETERGREREVRKCWADNI